MPNIARMKNQKVQISVRGSRPRKVLSLRCNTGWNTENRKVKRRTEMKDSWKIRGGGP